VEDDCVMSKLLRVFILKGLIFVFACVVEATKSAAVLKAEDLLSREEKSKKNSYLVDGLSKYVSVHDSVHDVGLTLVGCVVHQDFIRLLSGKGKCATGVHDEVDPEHLD